MTPCLPVPCADPSSPLSGFSSETPDSINFIGLNWGPSDPPPLGAAFDSIGVFAICESPVDQESADLCAARLSLEETAATWTSPGGFPIPVYYSSEIKLQDMCPDGSIFTFGVIAGLFAGFSQAEADGAALTYAQQQMAIAKVCLSDISGFICLNTDYVGTITVTSGALAVPPQTNRWELTAGELPDGLVFNGGDLTGNSATIIGVPVTPGVFAFGIRVTTPTGDYMQKDYTLTVCGMTGFQELAITTPDVNTIGPSAVFGVFPAGTYTVAYIAGAVQYHGLATWNLNIHHLLPPPPFTTRYGIFHDDLVTGEIFDPTADHGFTSFSTQSDLENFYAGVTQSIVHTGGQIGMGFSPPLISANTPGSPAPSFALSPTPGAVIQPLYDLLFTQFDLVAVQLQSGGFNSPTFSLDPSSALPTGGRLNSAGFLFGSVNVAGMYYFTVNVTDANGFVCPQVLTLIVGPYPVYSATPGMVANNTAYFDGGNSLPAGTYHICYSAGALRNTFTNQWYLNVFDAPNQFGYFGSYFSAPGVGALTFIPGTTAGYPTQGAVQSANAGLCLPFTHAGGAIGVFWNVADFPGVWAPGVPNPTFTLIRIS